MPEVGNPEQYADKPGTKQRAAHNAKPAETTEEAECTETCQPFAVGVRHGVADQADGKIEGYEHDGKEHRRQNGDTETCDLIRRHKEDHVKECETSQIKKEIPDTQNANESHDQEPSPIDSRGDGSVEDRHDESDTEEQRAEDDGCAIRF